MPGYRKDSIMFSSEETAARPVTTRELADYLQVTPRTIQNWRDSGVIPFVRINARVFRYKIADVEGALAKRNLF
jgi:excisionase family DNA binding protein